MREYNIWSISLGRWGGVAVRLHIFFLLFAALTLYLSWLAPSGPSLVRKVDAAAVISVVVLFLSVVWHEFWYCQAARRLGCTIRELVLVPWGGLSSVVNSRDPRSELIVHLVGPLSNAVVCVICIPAILLMLPNTNILGLLHPISPSLQIGADATAAGKILTLVFWVNWMLFLVNLIPTFPFAGGRALQAGLTKYLGRAGAKLVGVRVGQISAVSLLVFAWLIRDSYSESMVPAWFALLMLAIFLFFSATFEPHAQATDRDAAEDDLFGYDFSQGYTSLERSSESLDDDEASPISEWLEQRRHTRKKREAEQEAEEEQRVDEILARLHDGGMAMLSDDDRRLLELVSARYRSRLNN